MTFEAAIPAMRRAIRCALAQRGAQIADREDLEQDVLIYVWRARSKYDAARGNWPLFAEMAVRDVLRNAIRRTRCAKRSTQGRRVGMDIAVAVAEAPMHSAEIEEVRIAIAALPPKLARLVLLSASGYSACELAAAFGSTEGSVRTSLSRARKLIRAS